MGNYKKHASRKSAIPAVPIRVGRGDYSAEKAAYLLEFIDVLWYNETNGISAARRAEKG